MEEGRPADASVRRTDTHHTDAIRSLQAVAAELARPLPLDRIAAVVAEAGTRTLDAEILLVAIYDDAARHLRLVHRSGLPTGGSHRLPAALTFASSLLARTEEAGQPSLESVAEALMAVGPRTTGGSSVSHALAALIPADGRPLGIIVAARVRDLAFSEQDRAFLNVLAGVSALALERLRLSIGRSHVRHVPRRGPLDVRFTGSLMQVGDMEVDLEDQEVVIGDRRARVTPSELRLLLFLAAEPGRARTRGEILRHLWHTDHVGDERACDAHISNLRRKIERDPSRPERVVTIRGVGYALRVRPDPASRRGADRGVRDPGANDPSVGRRAQC